MITTVQTDMGDISYEGALENDPDLILPSGAKVKMQQLISLTNGECLGWFAEADNAVVARALGLNRPS